MGDMLAVDAGAVPRVVVVPLVQEQVLLLARLHRGALRHDRPDRGIERLGIRHIGSGDQGRQGQAVSFDQDRALHAVLGVIGRIGPDPRPPFGPCPCCHLRSRPMPPSGAGRRARGTYSGARRAFIASTPR